MLTSPELTTTRMIFIQKMLRDQTREYHYREALQSINKTGKPMRSTIQSTTVATNVE